MADKGENINIDIKLRANDNFTNSFLVARKATDKTALSTLTLEGSDAAIQRIVLTDIDLPVKTFIKVFVLAEKGENVEGTDQASGNVESVISKMYLYIDEDSEA
jgi:hypothetical protein